MFTDPFGLFAMDVEYADDRTKQEVDEMRKKSKTFDERMRDLENDHSILVRIGRGDTSPCGGGGGCSERMGKNEQGQQEYHVTINDGGIASLNALMRMVGSMANAHTTLGHEVYGHVVPWTNGFDCLDGFPGTPANRSCSVRRENVIRREMGYPRRPQY